MMKKKKLPIHPILFALFPVFSLISSNQDQLLFSDVFASILLVFALLAIVWGVLQLLMKDIAKSAIATSIFFILFFFFGHLVNLLEFSIFAYRIQYLTWAAFLVTTKSGLFLLLAVWTAVFLLVVYLLNKSRSSLAVVTSFFNTVAVLAFGVLVGWNMWLHWIGADAPRQEFVQAWQSSLDREFPHGVSVDPHPDLPDIYYIILDGYGRSDVLQGLYGYDNSEFMQFLEQRGFYIAQRSLTNYAQTVFSLSSSLNLDYLQDKPAEVKDAPLNYLNLRVMLENNRLSKALKQAGYMTRNVPTGYSYTDHIQADIITAPKLRINSFQNQLLTATPIPLLLDFPFLHNQYDFHRQRIQYGLDNLAERPQVSQPIFTFTHILAPHPPFVFDEQGGPVEPGPYFSMFDGDQYMGGPEGYREGYRRQVEFVTTKIQTIIDQILSQSSRPVIIVLQADHGPGMLFEWKNQAGSYLPERLSILNAYYFPDQDYSRLYPEISPVNSFRLILNKYLNYSFPPLIDQAWLASLGNPYYFYEVTEQARGE